MTTADTSDTIKKEITNKELNPLRCWDCKINFATKDFLHKHLYHHIKQPQVRLERIQLPPLKLTIKTLSDGFEVVNSPKENSPESPEYKFSLEDIQEQVEEEKTPPNVEEANKIEEEEKIIIDEVNAGEDDGIPGAELTPPPDSNSDYPKIRIKTSGLLKESLTITEITDDNPTSTIKGESKKEKEKESTIWGPNHDDPLKVADDNIMSIFNNNERAKDLGFCSSETEFMPLDRLEERNRNALQLYTPTSSSSSQKSLDSLTGLPMQALAQQVSRLQPSGNGMHQQNVLINIQQFPSVPPPQSQYQPPPPPPGMYSHHPQQPMYQPYPYQPPNPIYYGPAPGYPPPPPPPPPRPPQMHPQHQLPPQQSIGGGGGGGPMRPQTNQNPGRPSISRPRMPQNRPPMAQRQPMQRVRAPVARPQANQMGSRAARPRLQQLPNGQMRPTLPKRSTEALSRQLQTKKRRLDVLTPDKDDDDCQVIYVQPKNTDGGLPQIENIQGGTSEPNENNIMHLSDSITLSVRNPPVKETPPKKSDAKAVANILATRGITVTATPKPKDKEASNNAQKVPQLPPSINLNGAVSILPASKPTTTAKPTQQQQQESVPTVDLTDDSATPVNNNKSVSSKSPLRTGLPYKCDLCPAQYPKAIGLQTHRQTYHKTTGGLCEFGIPLINLKTPNIMQRLNSLGIYNYIPMSSSSSNAQDCLFALPITNTRNPGNVSALGTNVMLTLGPIKTLSKSNYISNSAKQK